MRQRQGNKEGRKKTRMEQVGKRDLGSQTGPGEKRKWVYRKGNISKSQN